MENDSGSGGLEFGDVENRQSDSEVVDYLATRSISEEYRDADRPGDGDVLETFAKMGTQRKYRNEKERPKNKGGVGLEET